MYVSMYLSIHLSIYITSVYGYTGKHKNVQVLTKILKSLTKNSRTHTSLIKR